ncbi:MULTISPECIES: hypothetical protein [unclassified Streptomyces]|uniref:hypothetical protein n=1 Tax=unclassified Streptomyces TaxID=2593676 RepID=UPI000CD55CB5|nr:MULTISPECIES: hypothetical protein [unclassified Streptomyces]AWL39326.1 hypothetical protein B9S64_15285 [Streptomyces sp. SM18]
MDTSEIPRGSDLDALVAALAGREMVVVAPHSTVNTGLVTGGQRHAVSHPAEGGTAAGPMRQGPVRAKHVETARRRFVPPPGFEDALAALDSGITVLLGEPGSGRETHALNLLAHGHENPVLVQVDGAVNFSRWSPRAQGVHGYLVTEPSDPFALRAWDLSRMESPLAEAGAHLVIVLADVPGLAGTLADHLGMPVVHHLPPDPRKVFSAHLADGSSNEGELAGWLRALEPGQLDELLPEGLPPRYAARAAEAVLRLGVAGGAGGAEVVRDVARTEGAEVVARAQTDPTLRADLLAVTVYGGLHRGVVTERARDLLRLAGPGGEQETDVRISPGRAPSGTRRWPETLRLLGAHCARGDVEASIDAVSFFWPSVSEAVWEVLCRDHTDLVPLLHSWLACPGPEAEQVERAGRAVAAMAVATGGRSMEHLHDLALAPSRLAPQVAGWCLGTAVQDPAVGRAAAELLEQWSVATEAPLRETVLHACHLDRGHLTEEQALRLLQQLMTTLNGDTDAPSVLFLVETLVRRFEAGDSDARTTVLRWMHDWSRAEDVPSLLTALCFPLMVDTDLAWWSDQMLADAESASGTVQLAAHALNEAASFAAMRDALLDWCTEAAGAEHPSRALSELLDGLVGARQPGFLRWLLAVERGPDALPGKELAARALAAWRAESPVSNSD